MSAARKLSWTPVRHGPVYCASACGGGCLWADYEKVQRRARALARRLGKGWRPTVHENLGWHYHVVSPCGRIKVRGYRYQTFRSYSAFLGDPVEGGGRWVESAKTPEEAIRRVVKAARAELRRIGAVLKWLEAWA